MTPNHHRYHVLTGGPGSGKTTVINALKRAGHATTVEAGRAVIARSAQAGQAPPWIDPISFAEAMLEWDMAEYRRAAFANGPVFFDRGIPDIVGYLTLIGRAVPARMHETARKHPYNPLVFCFPPWREIYRQDDERHQDFDEARRTWSVMVDTYEELGYQLTEVPKGDVATRVDFILSQLNS